MDTPTEDCAPTANRRKVVEVEMSYSRIQWLAIALPALLVGTFEFSRHHWFDTKLPGLAGNAIGALLVAAGVYGFVRYFIGLITAAERDLGRARSEAAVLAERQRIGREMHDGVAQALFHLRVRLRATVPLAEEGSLREVRQEIERIEGQVASAYDLVRAAISDLKQQEKGQDTAEALRRNALKIGAEAGLGVKLTLTDLPTMDPRSLQHLLAIVSEAMTNASRHGKASQVVIAGRPDEITIVDDGHGFDPDTPVGEGFGLLIMAERAAMIGGRLQVTSELGKGTRVKVTWGEGER